MWSERSLNIAYRYRWPVAAAVLLAVFGCFAVGWQRVQTFTQQVDALADKPPKKAEPRFFDLRTDIWFPTHNPALRAYRELETRYIGQDAIVIAFEDRDDPLGVFGDKALNVIAELTDKLAKVRYVRAVRSLTANPWIRWGKVGKGPDAEPGLIVSDLFAKPPASYSRAAKLRRMVAVLGARNAANLVGEAPVRELLGAGASFDNYIGEPRLLRNIVSEDGRATAILVQALRPRKSAAELQKIFGNDRERQETGLEVHVSVAQSEALAGVRKILAQTKGYDFHLAGGPVMQHYFQDTAQKDMRLMGVMFLVIGLLLFMIYRRASGVLLPLAVVMLAVVGMMGVIWAKGDLINGMTAFTPVILIAVGVADAVHLVTAYYALRRHYKDKRALIINVVQSNALPVLLTSVTTAIGFLSLMSSGITPMSMFGYTAAIGTGIAWLLSMTLVPAVLSLFSLPVSGAEAEAETETDRFVGFTDRLSDFVINRRAVIVATAIGLTVLAALGLSRLTIHTDMQLMFGKDDPQVADVMWLNDNIGGTGDLEILFDSDKPIAQSAAFLHRLDEFQKRLERESTDQRSPLRILANFDSPLGVLRKMHQVRNENKAAYYRVPVESDIPPEARKPHVIVDPVTEEKTVIPAQSADNMIAQYYVSFESGAKPTDNLSVFITPDHKSLRVTIRTRAASTGVTLAAYDRIRDVARTEFPDLADKMRLTGNYYMQMNMMVKFSRTMLESLAIALIVITLLISLVYRSLVIGVVSMVPNVVPIVMPLGLCALAGVPLDGPAVLVAAVGLGICVDDTIHFLTHYTRARDRGLAPHAAVKQTFREIGRALSYTTIVLVCGFAVMSFAYFRPNAMVGYLGATMIALAWIADFVVTPAVLSYLPAKNDSSSSPSSSSSHHSELMVRSMNP